jgi:TRAP-type transport system small permease protein
MLIEMGDPLSEVSGIETGKGRFDSLLAFVSNWLAVIACFTLVVMMLFVTVDVSGRNFFNWPLRGTFEIVGLLLIPGATWGLGLCQREKRHLRIPLIYDLLPQRVRLWLDALAYLVCLASCGLITWQMVLLAIKYQGMAMGSTTATLGLPYSPFMVALAWGFGWMGLIVVVDIIKTVREALKK